MEGVTKGAILGYWDSQIQDPQIGLLSGAPKIQGSKHPKFLNPKTATTSGSEKGVKILEPKLTTF